MHTRPTWAEVSLSALRHNFLANQIHVGPDVTVCAVVKADAYGHGAVECARALEHDGATWFGVTSTEEGVRLREAGIQGRILLMTGFWRGEQDAVVAHRLTPAVWQRESLEMLQRASEKLNVPAVDVHVKLDTGMSRLGVPPDDLPQLLHDLRACDRIAMEGFFTHLASAEIVDADENDEQMARFDSAVRLLHEQGFAPRYLHLANSAAIAARPDLHKNFVRPGISLYGYYLPFGSQTERPVPRYALAVRPVLTWKTRIIGLRDVAANQAVGYNGAYVTKERARIAVLPVGYADGLNRHLSSQGRVIVRGKYAPIVGNVSMDLTLVDVTSIPVPEIGDEVILLGEAGLFRTDAWDIARLSHTVPYEILCNISKRVPRIYVD
jgi:alanine racemase